MAATAKRTDPKLWERVKAKITRGSKGGDPGEWSARKAQLAVQEYKARGGGYEGAKAEDNHLRQWQAEEWGTKSGGKSRDTGERYLPKKAREALTEGEYRRTTEKKRADSRKGRQFSKQPRTWPEGRGRAQGAARRRHEGGSDGATPAGKTSRAARGCRRASSSARWGERIGAAE